MLRAVRQAAAAARGCLGLPGRQQPWECCHAAPDGRPASKPNRQLAAGARPQELPCRARQRRPAGDVHRAPRWGGGPIRCFCSLPPSPPFKHPLPWARTPPQAVLALGTLRSLSMTVAHQCIHMDFSWAQVRSCTRRPAALACSAACGACMLHLLHLLHLLHSQGRGTCPPANLRATVAAAASLGCCCRADVGLGRAQAGL